MVKTIMHGCCGTMGQVITNLAKDMADLEIVAGIDMNDKGNTTYPVFKSLEECSVAADVVIDFSSARAVDEMCIRDRYLSQR